MHFDLKVWGFRRKSYFDRHLRGFRQKSLRTSRIFQDFDVKIIEDYREKSLRILNRNIWALWHEIVEYLIRNLLGFCPEILEDLDKNLRHFEWYHWNFECSCCTWSKYIWSADLIFSGVEPQRRYKQWEYRYFGGRHITPPPVVYGGSEPPLNLAQKAGKITGQIRKFSILLAYLSIL